MSHRVSTMPGRRQLHSLQRVFDARISKAKKAMAEAKSIHEAAAVSLQKSVVAVNAERSSLSALTIHLRSETVSKSPLLYARTLATCEVIKRDLAREEYVKRNATQALTAATQSLAADRLALKALESRREMLANRSNALRTQEARRIEEHAEMDIEESASLEFSLMQVSLR